MLRLKCLGSSSYGNCLILTCGDDKLILDLGVSWSEILSGLDYDLTNVCGCLVSHCHQDHSKSIPKALYYCLDVYSCKEVTDKYDGVVELKPKEIVKVGNFMILPLRVNHDVENYAYLIYHKDLGRLVYAVDCIEFNYNLPSINHWLIEANYDEAIVFEKIFDDDYRASKSENHLSLSQTYEVLSRNLNDETKNVVLLHLSDNNSNSENFLNTVKQLSKDIRVYVAERGMDIEL